ncbi:MAG: ribosome silencing factor [Zoogloeaceae bacterium]|jgi:ribosome-associated protein|nr:ribosome silencing factor [Zoogloeaceae bacterium]
MELRKLQKIVVAALEDVKGREIEVLETAHLTPLFDRIVIACGDSGRQVRALAKNVADKVREAGGEILSVEGEEGGEWVLLDLGDLVVHVMQPEARRYYNLEELWRDAPASPDFLVKRRGSS